jgi:hypothetical protein
MYGHLTINELRKYKIAIVVIQDMRWTKLTPQASASNGYNIYTSSLTNNQTRIWNGFLRGFESDPLGHKLHTHKRASLHTKNKRQIIQLFPHQHTCTKNDLE